jgi:hypothetical protein
MGRDAAEPRCRGYFVAVNVPLALAVPPDAVHVPVAALAVIVPSSVAVIVTPSTLSDCDAWICPQL